MYILTQIDLVFLLDNLKIKKIWITQEMKITKLA